MAAFITKSDYYYTIKQNRLDQVLDGDDALLDDAEETAIVVVKDSLSLYYDTDAIFATTGDARPRQVLRWVKDLALYFIYERIEDELVPERIVKNYNDTLGTLEKIEDGKKQVDLPRLIDPDTE